MEAGDRTGVAAAGAAARTRLDAKHAARERALSTSRAVIRECANAIRATHRGEHARAEGELDGVGARLEQLGSSLAEHPDLLWAGYVQDAHKEYVEARATLALVRGRPVPRPEELGVDASPYLNGLGETVGELRRRALDLIRRGEAEAAEATLEAMEDIYNLLVTVDYPDALTGGLRRTTDSARGILERTRGDLTLALSQQRLEAALRRAAGEPA